tara:strand:- start:177 stop:722 length:546 start_codon:yes stop_codon:yes gene_type:complete
MKQDIATINTENLMASQLDRHAIRLLHSTGGQWLVERLNADYSFQGFTITGKQTMAELVKARDAIKDFCKPASYEEILKALIELKSLTVSRDLDELDNDLKNSAYINRLSEYPRDAVLEVLKDAPNHNKFFPAWEELKRELDWKSARRLQAIQTIEDKINAKRYATLTGTAKLRISSQSPA